MWGRHVQKEHIYSIKKETIGASVYTANIDLLEWIIEGLHHPPISIWSGRVNFILISIIMEYKTTFLSIKLKYLIPKLE